MSWKGPLEVTLSNFLLSTLEQVSKALFEFWVSQRMEIFSLTEYHLCAWPLLLWRIFSLCKPLQFPLLKTLRLPLFLSHRHHLLNSFQYVNDGHLAWRKRNISVLVMFLGISLPDAIYSMIKSGDIWVHQCHMNLLIFLR